MENNSLKQNINFKLLLKNNNLKLDINRFSTNKLNSYSTNKLNSYISIIKKEYDDYEELLKKFEKHSYDLNSIFFNYSKKKIYSDEEINNLITYYSLIIGKEEINKLITYYSLIIEKEEIEIEKEEIEIEIELKEKIEKKKIELKKEIMKNLKTEISLEDYTQLSKTYKKFYKEKIVTPKIFWGRKKVNVITYIRIENDFLVNVQLCLYLINISEKNIRSKLEKLKDSNKYIINFLIKKIIAQKKISEKNYEILIRVCKPYEIEYYKLMFEKDVSNNYIKKNKEQFYEKLPNSPNNKYKYTNDYYHILSSNSTNNYNSLAYGRHYYYHKKNINEIKY